MGYVDAMSKLPQLKWPVWDAGTRPETNLTAPELCRAGNAARDQENWAAAAAAYGRYLQLVQDDGPLWVQYGHMLKETGLLGPASESYDRAMALMPSDSDLRVQRAILHKCLGEFDDAIRLFNEARALGFADGAFIDRELAILSKIDNRKTFSKVVFERSAPPLRIYVSSAVGAPRRETDKELDRFLGSTNYSYGFSLKGFLLGLDAMGLPYDIITNPEYTADIRKQSFSGCNLHFAFYPPDAPRLLKGAYNILVMAWEFERLRRPYEQLNHHAFGDPVLMLNRADEVWMVSSFGTDAVRKSGVESVYTVPSPVLSGVVNQPRPALPQIETMFRAASHLEGIEWIPLAIVPGLQSVVSQEAQRRRTSLRTIIVENLGDQSPMFFLAVFNIYDYRKQLKPVLDAFVRLAKVRPNVYLLLKVSFVHRAIGDLNEFMLRHQINDPSEMAPPLVSDRIWMTADVLSREELTHLYDLSTFYVSTPHGEGQNLPLLEAMGRGVVPVSVDHTAMRDYISPETGIVVRSTRQPFNLRLRERYGMNDIDTYYVSGEDAYQALDEAAGLGDARYAALSRNALAVVHEKFGLAPFRSSIEQVIERASAHARSRDA
jgi:glycosyltransferase involved in cell wall biosynthesis